MSAFMDAFRESRARNAARDVPAAHLSVRAAVHEDGAVALDATAAYLDRFVSFPSPVARDACALFAAYTHVADRFDVAPRLLIESESFGCGKSTLRRAIQHVAARPMMMSRATGAAMYQALGHYDKTRPRGACPTLFLDEMDTLPGNILDQISGVVNSGYEAGEPVWRNRNGWNTFGPAVIVGIEVKLADSTRSRSVEIVMRRADAGSVDRAKHMGDVAEGVRRKLSGLAARMPAELARVDVEPRGLTHRDLDKWEPLLVVAGAAGGRWRDRGYAAALALK